MYNQILEFHLSHHFMLRGWDRNIDATILNKVLTHVTVSKQEKKLAIITPSFFSQIGIAVKTNSCSVILLNHKLLKTAYWCEHPNYFFKKEKETEFQIIY